MTARPVSFTLTFFALFALTYVFLAAVDSLPEPVGTERQPSASAEIPDSMLPSAGEAPVRIVAVSIGLDVPVSNPNTTDVDALDQALLSGAVRYPTSALLGAEGTALLFGHSSYLPIVHNQNYKAFDGIQDLKTGETISVYSEHYEYRYSVTGVRQADATEDVVELPAIGRHIALVTCDSFGKKTDRFIVTADFIGAYPL